ncbi:MAG: protein kinase [Myxococcales bacterium]|jgi:serine/threonine-protein kinase
MNQQANSAELDGAPSTPAIGDVIAGKYRVESVVGSGGMGVVLCATHLELGQRVAIKVLTVPEDDSRRDEARERFLREGRATAALVSDHVVRIYDVGTLHTGAPFMVMELLRGQDLARTLQQSGPLGIELACDCIRQASEAISCAHAQGIVHRDLKPSNLFLTQRSDGSPLIKVLDFGISKTMGKELEPLTGNLTETRSVLGTPFYMSPEQVRDAKKVDVRTDIWSLGLILHELLTASPAFEGTTLPGVCAAIAADPPAALRLKRPEVPVEVEAIVLKCLEKDPNRRFQSARELFDKLTPWTGRADSSLLSPLSDQTIRSSSLAFELGEGSTVSLPPSQPSDSGTLASAVFTQSGERVVNGAHATAHSQVAATEAPPAPQPASLPSGSGLSKRNSIALGASVLIGLGLIIAWALSNSSPAPQAAAPTSAPSLPVLAPRPPSSPTFSVLIDSNPVGAQVFEAESLLGTTPLRLSVDPNGGPPLPRTFSVRKSGYLPYTIVQGASAQDTRVLAELSRDPGAAAPTPAPAPSVAARAPAAAAHNTKPRPVPSAAPAKPGNDIFMQR